MDIRLFSAVPQWEVPKSLLSLKLSGYFTFALSSKNYYRCIGTVQHLKSKFGKGYFLEIKLKDCIENLEVDRLQREIQYIFPNANRQER